MAIKKNSFLSETNIGWLVFGILLLFWFVRAPNLILAPRLWAEEGSGYLTNAYYNGFFGSLFFLPKYTAGYLLLCSSLPSEIASIVFSLKAVPAVMTYFSIIFYLICLHRIIFGDFVVFSSRYQNWILAVCLVFFIPATGTFESWANTINLQVYCGVYTVLVVISKDEWYVKKYRGVMDKAILALCVLSGPYSIFIGLSFLLRYYFARNKTNLIFAIILIFGVLIQGSSYLYLSSNDWLSAKKTIALHWDTLFAGSFRYFILDPVLGEQNTIGLLRRFNTYYNGDNIIAGDRFYKLATLGILSLILFVFSLHKNLKLKTFIVFLSFSLPVFLLVPYFAAYGMPGGRYSVLPSFIVAIFLTSLVQSKTNIYLKNLVIIILGLGICFGVGEFWSWKTKYFAGNSKTMPDWEEQVKGYQKQKGNYIMTIWPYPQWKLKLPYKGTIVELKSKLNMLRSDSLITSKSIKLDKAIVIPDLRLKINVESVSDSVEVNVKLLRAGNIISSKAFIVSDVLTFNTWGRDNPVQVKRNKLGLIQFDEIIFTAAQKRKFAIKKIKLMGPYNAI